MNLSKYIYSQPKSFLFIPIVKLFFVIVYLPDPSIPIVIKLGILPYGFVWSFVNFPIYFQYSLWSSYLFVLDIPITQYLYRKIPIKTFAIVQLYDIWLFADEFNNISILWFTSLGLINPWFLILSIISKLPVTWCVPCINYALGSNGTWRFSSFPRIFSYSLILISWILISIHWIRIWHHGLKEKQ
jgi:hypothetical protein